MEFTQPFGEKYTINQKYEQLQQQFICLLILCAVQNLLTAAAATDCLTCITEQFLAAAAAMGTATSDGTSGAVSVASTATARVVEIDGSDTRHRSKRKLYRSETKRDEVSGEPFQVNQTDAYCEHVHIQSSAK